MIVWVGPNFKAISIARLIESRLSSGYNNMLNSVLMFCYSLIAEVELMNEKNRQLSQECKSEETKELEYEDIDKENLNDPHLVSLYAFHIFNYYKEREVRYCCERRMYWYT